MAIFRFRAPISSTKSSHQEKANALNLMQENKKECPQIWYIVELKNEP